VRQRAERTNASALAEASPVRGSGASDADSPYLAHMTTERSRSEPEACEWLTTRGSEPSRPLRKRPPRGVLIALMTLGACESAGGTPIALLDYEARVPRSFQARTATSSMRLAEFGVPRSDGTQAEVIVYYFGPGQGGSAEANIARWQSQFSTPDGGVVTPRVGILEGTAFPTTIAELEGAYARGVGAGPGSAPAQPDQALVAAIVETPRGSLFLQLVGDRSAVADSREDFLDLAGSIRPGRRS
jgi:hypothetical protein